jgi:protein SCO1/2
MNMVCRHPGGSRGPGLERRWIPAFAGMTALFFLVPLHASTPEHQNKILEQVGFTQNLNAQVPLNLPFRNEKGDIVPLSTYFGKKPVLLNLVYFQCPMLCTEVLNGTVRTLRAMPLKIGKDFNVVTVSFDARESPKMAAMKKALYIDRYGHAGAETGWAFLTGTEPSIKALADAVGFHFAYDPELDQFAHASGIMILTPEGRVSHYFFGVEYPVQDVRLSLDEASNGKIGSPVDQLLLYCYHYDPTTGRYGLVIMRVVRIAGLATLLLLVTFVVTMLLRERADRLSARSA